jgi:hypothetical protein
LSGVFARQNVRIKEVEEKIWLVTFMNYRLCQDRTQARLIAGA